MILLIQTAHGTLEEARGVLIQFVEYNNLARLLLQQQTLELICFVFPSDNNPSLNKYVEGHKKQIG